MKFLSDPSIPKITRVVEKDKNGLVEITWNHVKEIHGYELQIDHGNNIENLSIVKNKTPYLYMCGTHGPLYGFKLRCINETGKGDWSDIKRLILSK